MSGLKGREGGRVWSVGKTGGRVCVVWRGGGGAGGGRLGCMKKK